MDRTKAREGDEHRWILKSKYTPEMIEYFQSFKCHLATTRFNNKTWRENQRYLESQRHPTQSIACIYACEEPIQSTFEENSIFFVLEMNNEENRIMGIGVIRNKVFYNKHLIYEDPKYNKFSYIGKYHIHRNQLNEQEEKVLKIFDVLCFKGSRHLKRLKGIKLFPIDILYYCKQRIDVMHFFIHMMKKYMMAPER